MVKEGSIKPWFVNSGVIQAWTHWCGYQNHHRCGHATPFLWCIPEQLRWCCPSNAEVVGNPLMGLMTLWQFLRKGGGGPGQGLSSWGGLLHCTHPTFSTIHQASPHMFISQKWKAPCANKKLSTELLLSKSPPLAPGCASHFLPSTLHRGSAAAGSFHSFLSPGLKAGCCHSAGLWSYRLHSYP